MIKITDDGGHAGYGVTPGKRAPDGSMYEWDFNSAVVKYMNAELAKYEGVAVLRIDDPTGKRDVPLKERTDRVNGWNSNVHISVHANATGNGSEWVEKATGIETFVYPEASKTSIELATKIQAALIKKTGMKDRGVKEADFHMLREVKCPAVLVECGFMTSKADLKQLKSDTYRKDVALAIVGVLVAHFNLTLKWVKKPLETKTEGKKVYLETGWFREDSPGLKEVQAFLKGKGFKYSVKEWKE